MQDSQPRNVTPAPAGDPQGRPAGRRKGRWVQGVYTLLTAVLVAFLGVRLLPHVGAVLGIGDAPGKVPAFDLVGLDGRAYTPATLRGQVVLINGWATWCPPCRAEMPVLEQMYQRHKGRGLVVLGLSADTLPPSVVADWLAARNVTFPTAIGRARDFDVLEFDGVLPTSWLLDKQGRVRHQVVGPIGAVSLELAVRRLLDE